MNQGLYPEMEEQFTHANVRIYICAEDAHFSMWDDTENYFGEIIRFLKEVQSNTFKPEK